jgi:hypothetical protein
MFGSSFRRRRHTIAAFAEVKVSDENGAELALGDNPVTYAEAAQIPSWRQAMKQVFDSLMKN